MPAIPSSISEPIWDQFAVLLPSHADCHPLGCHRPRISDRVVFDKLVQVLVFGCAYHRIADETCSASTLRRRRDEWIALGIMDTLQAIALAAYDRMIGLELADLAVDGCITKAPCGGEMAGRNPVDRGQQGLKRSLAVDAAGIPLGAVAAPANRHDALLLASTLDALVVTDAAMTIHLDRGYDCGVTRILLAVRGLRAIVRAPEIDAETLAPQLQVNASTIRNGRARYRRHGWCCRVAYVPCRGCGGLLVQPGPAPDGRPGMTVAEPRAGGRYSATSTADGGSGCHQPRGMPFWSGHTSTWQHLRRPRERRPTAPAGGAVQRGRGVPVPVVP